MSRTVVHLVAGARPNFMKIAPYRLAAVRDLCQAVEGATARPPIRRRRPDLWDGRAAARVAASLRRAVAA